MEIAGGRQPLRILVVLPGDITKDRETFIKYNTFIEALNRRFTVVGIHNAKLRGLPRLLNALTVWHPNKKKWRERAKKNISAFILRSKQTAAWVRSMQDQADVIVQLGVMFDAGWEGVHLPNIIYTDYTARLSALRRDAGRSPLRGDALQRWFELEGQAMKRSAHVCVRSQLVRNSVVDNYHLPPEQVSIIGGGANLDVMPSLVDRPANRHPTILFIGLDFYRKGGDLVLKAFALARASVPNAGLLFLTNHAIPDDLPISGVKLIPPTWKRKELLGLYEQADIFVLPSRLETWGDVILEAMAYGLPCVGVMGQAMEEIIRDGKTGFLAGPEDVTALANAFIELLTNTELRRQMRLAGYDLVSREFTWDLVVERLAPIINNAVKQNQRE